MRESGRWKIVAAILLMAGILWSCEQPTHSDQERQELQAVAPDTVPGETVSHDYLDGVTPTNIDPDSAQRTYPVVQGDWEGPGGDKRWLGWNLGATRAPSSAEDTEPGSNGWYFQFNHKGGIFPDVPNNEKVVQHISGPVSGEQFEELDSDWTGNDPCRALLEGNWRIPTAAEWEAAAEADAQEKLNLHFGGYILGSLSFLSEVGSSGAYWSSTQHFSANRGLAVRVDDDGIKSSSVMLMWSGMPLRCIED